MSAPSSASSSPAVPAPPAPRSAPPAPAPSSASTPSALLSSAASSASSQACGLLRQQKGALCHFTNEAKRAYNEQVAKPTNQAARTAAAQWSVARREYPWQIVAGVTGTALLCTMPFGRRAALRNGLLALGASSMAVAPATTVGWVTMMRDRAAISVGWQPPHQAVVLVVPQQQQTQQTQQ